jgi:hypothetical protein
MDGAESGGELLSFGGIFGIAGLACDGGPDSALRDFRIGDYRDGSAGRAVVRCATERGETFAVSRADLSGLVSAA